MLRLSTAQIALIAALTVAGSLPSVEAIAAKRIVILPFSGPRGGATTSAVRRVLSRFRTVSAGAFLRSARRNGRGNAGRIAAARTLRVSAIVRGSISRIRGRWALRVIVASGHSGRAVGSSIFPLRGTRIDGLTSRRISSVVSRYIARTRPPAGSSRRVVRRKRKRRPPRVAAVRSRPPATPRPLPEPAPAPKTRRSNFDDGGDMDDSNDSSSLQDDPKPTISPARRVATAQDPPSASNDDNLGFEVDDNQRRRVAQTRIRRKSRDDDADNDDDDDDPIKRRSSRRPSWQSVVEVSGGLLLVNRKFSFNDPVSPKEAPDYSTPAVVPALYVEGAVYPIAAFSRSAAANIGLAARYFRVVGLQSKVKNRETTVDTLVQEFEVGLRYRWNIFQKASSPTLRFGIDYGRLMFFILDEANQIPLPNISYTYLKFAIAGIDVPIYRKRPFSFGASASFDYLLVFSAGDIERTDSSGYGTSSTGGIDMQLGLFFKYDGFFAKATGFYRRMFFSFDGRCFKKNMGCNYAGGALDIYAGISANVGYAY